ncbi:MAG: hypothetical protein L6R28_14505 [Planctomycetes bacterium]|nr:hypothetical protein [Planctomycetota bacterium]
MPPKPLPPSPSLTLGRWLLHECVRANPFYVISAALMAYGIHELNTAADPQIGKLGGIAIALGLLAVYELALAAAATVILRRRTNGGRDLHGLMIVAGLFLSGSLLALDELIAARPAEGPWLLAGALVLAWLKTEWYGRLRGLRLPPAARYVTLLLIVAHASAPLLGALQVRGDLSAAMAQDLSWLAGWVALCALFAVLEPPELTFTPETDVLQTPVCGGTSVGIAAVVGVAHLMTSDWVFDRPFAYARILPAAVLMGAVLLARRQRRMVKLVGLDFAAACAPALLLQWVWWHDPLVFQAPTASLFFRPSVQLALAGLATYALLAWSTGRKGYYWGTSGILAAPAGSGLWMLRLWLPNFRAFLSAGLAFVALAAAMVLSLTRERLLRRFAPTPPSEDRTEAARTTLSDLP